MRLETPSMAALRNLLRFWPYLLLFCASLAIFLAYFYFNAKSGALLAEVENRLAQNGVVMEGVEVSHFPPDMRIKKLAVSLPQGVFAFSNVEIIPRVFPLSVSMDGRFLKGTIHADIGLGPLFSPRVSDISFRLDKLSLPALMEIFKDKNPFVKILGGAIDGSGHVTVPWKDSRRDWAKASGKIDISMTNGSFEPQIQLLRQKTLDNASSMLKLRIEGSKCIIKEFAARSGDISLDASGHIERWYNGPDAALDLETTLRVPPRALNSALIPPRTLAKLEETGAVHARIERTLARPSLHIMD